jgi:hypothetical protein
MAQLKGSNGRGMSGTGLQATVAGQMSSRSFSAGSGMPKVLTVVLCEDMLYRTDGSDSVFTLDVYDLPEIRELGPMVHQIRVHYECEGATTHFQCQVTTAWSVRGRTWSSPSTLLPAQTGTQTGQIGNWFTTDSAFGLLMRYAIEVKNSTGFSTIESGRVTVVLEIELKS